MIDIQYDISFRCATQWFDIYIPHTVIAMEGPVSVRRCARLRRCYCLHFLRCTWRPTRLLYKSARLHLLYFLPISHCLTLRQLFSCAYECVSFVHLFSFLDSTCMWNETVFVFLWLIALSIAPCLGVPMLSLMVRSHSFPWLSNIPVCICVYTCVYVYVCMYVHVYAHIYVHVCVCMYLCVCVNPFMYWWAPSCIHVVTFANNTAMNTGMHIAFYQSLFLKIFSQPNTWEMYHHFFRFIHLFNKFSLSAFQEKVC